MKLSAPRPGAFLQSGLPRFDFFESVQLFGAGVHAHRRHHAPVRVQDHLFEVLPARSVAVELRVVGRVEGALEGVAQFRKERRAVGWWSSFRFFQVTFLVNGSLVRLCDRKQCPIARLPPSFSRFKGVARMTLALTAIFAFNFSRRIFRRSDG